MARVGISIAAPGGNLIIDDRYHNVALVPAPTTQTPIYAHRQGDGKTLIFDEPTSQGSGPGIRIYNSIDYRVAFDSRLKYARVVEVPSGTFTANSTDGSLTVYSKTYAAGRTYAYSIFVAGTSAYFKTVGAGTRACSATVSVALNSAGTLSIVATTVTDAEPLNHTPTAANQAKWMVAVLDVTGY